MSRLIRRLLLLSIVCAGAAFGQVGSFGQIAYGGSWQTTFTLVNPDTTNPVSGTLNFFGDSGLPLNAPVVGSGNISSVPFTIPKGSSQNIVLSTSDSTTIEGWANLSIVSGSVRGQASFRNQLGGLISEAVVPLNVTASICLIQLPPVPVISNLTLLPFDNTVDSTTGQHVTSLAIANASGATLSLPIEFDDQNNNQLVTGTLTFGINQHQAFVTTDSNHYPALAGKKGIIRIGAGMSTVAVVGLLSNQTGTVTTIIPITQ